MKHMKLNKYNGIRNRKAYKEALIRIEALMNNYADARPQSDEGKEIGLLAALIENYEDVRFPLK